MGKYRNVHQTAFYSEITLLIRQHGVSTVVAWILEVLADVLKEN